MLTGVGWAGQHPIGAEGAMRTYHVGRLIDHVHLRVSDLAASARFYREVLDTLGVPHQSGEGWFQADELYLSEDRPPTAKLHLAFQAPDRETVQRFHAAALSGGGTDNGAPGERAYHPGYYAAFVLDPDGNNVEAVHHGPARRSAESVQIVPEQ
jgi:catechol 2,3-dioxygenase-like lactoylglutathione lyase family enzyme